MGATSVMWVAHPGSDAGPSCCAAGVLPGSVTSSAGVADLPASTITQLSGPLNALDPARVWAMDRMA